MSELQRRMAVNPDRICLGVVDEVGGIHFWTQLSRSEICGIEQHGRKPLYDWSDPKVPDNNDCWLLGGPCWHDGSSLVAEEVYLPIYLRCNESGDFEPLWKKLEGEHRRRFGEAKLKEADRDSVGRVERD